jgi:zinc/manganese transport system substrate-binding protein
MRALLLFATALVAGAVLIGCGDDADSGTPGKTEVVATTTQVADFVRNVGGDRVAVHQVLQPNSDPHEYEPRPSDARAVADAQAVFRSGGDVDEWMDDVIENAGGDARQATLIDAVRTRASEDEEVDPHWWQDPRNAELAVKAIRAQLIEVDPAGRSAYERNAARYLDVLARLDRETAACIDELPAGERNLVTTHDALGYYAGRYGLHVIGAVIPSLSTQAQPSAKDVQELVDQIEATRVKAIYPESSINPKLEEAVARESGARTGAALWADTLGPEGSSGATYVGSIAANTAAIVDGLSGGAVACRPAS